MLFFFFWNSPTTRANRIISDIAACVGEMVEATSDFV